MQHGWKKSLLCIVPPYSVIGPPAGAAALLGYLKSQGCDDFGFVDFRLWSVRPTMPTFSTIGIFAETNVVDVPDLPLVLGVLRAFREGLPLLSFLNEGFEDYCIARGIKSQNLKNYLEGVDRFFEFGSTQVGRPEFLGFSTWSSNFLTTLMAAAHFKKRNPKTLIVAGGPQVTESPHSAKLGLQSGLFDAVVVGEGEGPLLDLYRSFSQNNGHVSKNISGVMQFDRETGNFILPSNQQIKLAELPIPSFNEIPIQSYQMDVNKTVLPFQLSRGCTDKCAFCSEWVFWKSFRFLEPARALEQIYELQKNYSLGKIAFTDSLLNGSPGRLRSFAEGLLAKKTGITWSGFMRANMDPDFAKLLKSAGCSNVFIGIESMSDETLAAMNKRRTQADNINALEAFLSAGIKVKSGLIPGFPGDSRERFIKTAQTLHQMQSKYPGMLKINVEPFAVSPGQPIFKNLNQFGLVGHHWPEEILNIDPFYRNITDDIYCHVTGRNQGIDRSGEYQIARLYSADPNAGQSDNFSYQDFDKNFENGVAFDWIHDDWVVFSMMTPLATTYRLIMSRAEWTKYLKLVEKAFPKNQVYDGPMLLKNAEIKSFLEQIENRHIISSKSSEVEISSSVAYRDFEISDGVSLSPFGVLRELKNRKQIAFVNLFQVVFIANDLATPQLLRFLKNKRTLSEIKKQQKNSKTLQSRLLELTKFGVLVHSN